MANPIAKVTITATHVVQGQRKNTLQDSFVLGPFDQLGHFATPISAVWIYESSSIDLIPLEKLHKAISRLLDYYPHLTGRIRVDPSTNVRSVNRLGTGMHLVEARCDATLRSFARDSSVSGREFDIFDFPRYGNALLTPWDKSLEGVQRDPVFTIQRTEFACSAVAIGMRLSHVVGGAGSFLGLYQDLAEIYRAIGDPAAGNEPVQLRTPPYLTPFMVSQMLHMDAHERSKALEEKPAAYSLRSQQPATATPTAAQDQFWRPLDNDQFVGRSLSISPSALATLKRQAVNPDDSTSRASSFTALTAHFWQRIHLARLVHAKSLSVEETSVYSKSMYGTSVNFIPHFGLPKRSFGNTVVTPIVELDSTTLVHAKLWEVAEIINSLVRRVSLDETRKLGSWIAAQPEKSDIQLDFKVTPTTLITTGWHHFPLYSGSDMDISPVFATPIMEESLSGGTVLFVEPKAKDGGIEAIALMTASTWALLDADKEFITTWDQTGR